jgi:flagellar basal-body rod protein FlgG
MLEGMYTAAAGMAAQQDQLDAVAEDLANVNTTGYKHTRLAFRDLLDQAGAATTSLGPSTLQGALRDTGEPLDVALTGPGAIAIQGGQTRDGALRLDNRGQITTSTGRLLNPPITVPKGTEPADIAIAQDGTVSVAGRRIGAIRILGSARLTQGALEASNVDIGDAMTAMMQAQRGYELASKAIQISDEMLQIANQVKR